MFLTPAEIAQLTCRKNRDAQARVLVYLEIEHRVRPDGSLLVLRSTVESLLGAATPAKLRKRRQEPNWDALAETT